MLTKRGDHYPLASFECAIFPGRLNFAFVRYPRSWNKVPDLNIQISIKELTCTDVYIKDFCLNRVQYFRFEYSKELASDG